METLYWLLIATPAILVASTVHEYAHGWMAYKLGDPTAKANGRLTLNPLAHIDPIGMISMLLFRFGWSKPVPVNEYNFERKELGMMLTALAGPVSNFILAGITALVYYILDLESGSLVELILYTFGVINLSLGIFNLVPIPPLDGHKIIRGLLPKSLRYYWESLEKYSTILIILLILPFSPLSTFISNWISITLNFALNLLGFL